MKNKGLTIVLFAVVTFGFIFGLLNYNKKLDEMLGKEIIQATAADFVLSERNVAPETESGSSEADESVGQSEVSEEITVPSLIGLTEDEAVSVLDALGLIADAIEANDEEVAEGKIFSQNPLPDEAVTPGSVIRFIVSIGEELQVNQGEQIIVPNVIGLSKAAAEAKLIEEGFTVDYEYNPSEHYDDGYVYSQNYKVSAVVNKGTTVKIRISTGN
jgi:hypothetical protein